MKKNLPEYVVLFIFILKFIIASVLIGSLLSGKAYAQDANVEEYQSADAELKITYKELMGKLDAQDKKKLTEAQVKWRQFKLSDCGYGLIDKFTCLTARTKERNQHLKDRQPKPIRVENRRA
jgi:hypothetical protein